MCLNADENELPGGRPGVTGNGVVAKGSRKGEGQNPACCCRVVLWVLKGCGRVGSLTAES